MLKDEKGLIAIEMLITFVLFILCISFIVMWVNVASAQLRVHNSLTQSAEEIAFYTHILGILGVVDALRVVEGEAAPMRRQLDTVLESGFSIFDTVTAAYSGARDELSGLDARNNFQGLENVVDLLENAAGNVGEDVSRAVEVFEDWSQNPQDMVDGFVWLAARQVSGHALNYLFGLVIAPSFFWRYLEMDGVSGRDYLRSTPIDENSVDFVRLGFDLRGEGIDGAGVQDVRFLSGERADEIRMGVSYNIDFGNMFDLLTVLPEMPAEQYAQTRAWVGDGGRFRPGIVSNEQQAARSVS